VTRREFQTGVICFAVGVFATLFAVIGFLLLIKE